MDIAFAREAIALLKTPVSISLLRFHMTSLDEVRAYWETHPAGLVEVGHLAADRRALFDERDQHTRLLYPRLDEQHGFARAR